VVIWLCACAAIGALMAPAIAAMASILFRMSQLLRDDARQLAPARNPIQFIAPSIVPRKWRSHSRPFLAFFAGAGT
jgi:hypothetical protein